MKTQVGTRLVPISTFGLAVLLAVFAGTSARALTVRAAAAVTGKCHDGFFIGGGTKLVVEIDGLIEPLRDTTEDDLHPFRFPERKNSPKPDVVKAQGSMLKGDLIVKATAQNKAGPAGVGLTVLASELNAAEKNLTLVGEAKDCCHTDKASSKAASRFGVHFDNVLIFGNVAARANVRHFVRVRVGRHNCHGNLIETEETLTVDLRGTADGDAINPTALSVTGSIITQGTTYIDGAPHKDPTIIEPVQENGPPEDHQFHRDFDRVVKVKESKDYRKDAYSRNLSQGSVSILLIGKSGTRASAGANTKIRELHLEDTDANDAIVVPP